MFQWIFHVLSWILSSFLKAMFLGQQFRLKWVQATSRCLWDLQCKPWKSVLNGLKCDIPSDVLQWQIHLKRCLKCSVNNWCPIKVYEMKFSHGLITWAEFGPLKCTSKLHFHILTPPRIKLISRLYFSSFCRGIHFQSFNYFSAFRHKIKFGKIWENLHWIYM